ncbi:MAG TPA: Rrf2 family transcriptional regulator [Thermomicrobiales bacterium]|jgi:Rrf2 family protein
MKLSRESQYGILGTVYLAHQPVGTIRQVGQVAEACGLARPFLAKIFGRLVHAGVLRSYRGRERGYALARPAREVSVKAIVEAIEGPDVFQRCVFWSDACSDSSPCILHHVWQTVRPVAVELMARTTLEDLVRDGGQPDRLETMSRE